MTIYRKCFMCGNVNSIELPDDLEEAIDYYEMGIGYIQDIPVSPAEREFIKTGMCFDCQHKIFDMPEDDEEIA